MTSERRSVLSTYGTTLFTGCQLKPLLSLKNPYTTLSTVMFTTRASVFAFITGAVAGLTAGLLLAPQSLVTSRNGLAYRLTEEGADSVDLGGATTAPLSEISEDADQLEALRTRLAAGQS